MPLSREAKSIAHRWDDLPAAIRTDLKNQMTEAERLMREKPEVAKRIHPDLNRQKPK